MAARMSLFAALFVIVIIGAVAVGLLRYMTAVPGEPHSGELPALTPQEQALSVSLRRHIARVAAAEHNVVHYAELENVAAYLEDVLASYGYRPGRQEFAVQGRMVRNIDAVIEPAPGNPDPEVIVVGAHYDSVFGSPGANDNATGVAAVLELARLLADLRDKGNKRIRLALFVNEEPPYFKTDSMGSLRYARALAERRERVIAMYSLETLGYYSSEPGSQKYPFPFGLLYPNRGDFVAIVGTVSSRPLVWRTIRSFRSHTKFPTIGGVAPGFVPGIDWSDHWAFGQLGFQAAMVTDTALFRYPHYHLGGDTPDKVDTGMLARAVKGVERVVRDLAQ
jgi:hypothetical protein